MTPIFRNCGIFLVERAYLSCSAPHTLVSLLPSLLPFSFSSLPFTSFKIWRQKRNKTPSSTTFKMMFLFDTLREQSFPFTIILSHVVIFYNIRMWQVLQLSHHEITSYSWQLSLQFFFLKELNGDSILHCNTKACMSNVYYLLFTPIYSNRIQYIPYLF